MPAPMRAGARDSGLPIVTPKRINNTISIEKYYRSASLLVRQAAEYRAQHDDLQLYTMLMRLASLIVETIPTHKDFFKDATAYKKIRTDLVTHHLPELEDLKLSLKLRLGQDQDSWHDRQHNRTPDTVQISTSNLPQLDWGYLPAVPTGPANQLPPSSSFDVDLLDSFQSIGVSPPAQAAPGVPPLQSSHSMTSDLPLPSFKTSIRPVSQATRDRHALMPSMTSEVRRPSSSGASASYPSFDASPWRPIDYQINPPASQNEAAQPSAPPFTTNGQAGNPSQSLMDVDARPQPSLSLGPQELQVQHLAPPTGPPDPNGTCNHPPSPPPPPPPPPPPEDQPGQIAKKKDLREVHVAMLLMEEFLHYAGKNTQRNVESCGILAGKLDTEQGIFRITTLIIPKQQGTSDTVQALAEEEIFAAQDSRSLYPMGWIHTHPSQTCFLSSIDVHTQCGYQTMLEEAVAIVMAPRDRQNKCGIFRLNTPAGLKMVQNCPLQGFHHHPMAGDAPIYEKCGHVYLNERIKHDVVDLR